MKRKHYTEEEIIAILTGHEAGAEVTVRRDESLGHVSPLEFLNHRGHADLSGYGWT